MLISLLKVVLLTNEFADRGKVSTRDKLFDFVNVSVVQFENLRNISPAIPMTVNRICYDLTLIDNTNSWTSSYVLLPPVRCMCPLRLLL